MFLLTGNSRSPLNNLRSEVRSTDLLTNLNGGLNGVANGSSSNFTKIAEAPVKPGEISAHDSLKSLLDCCILYYYAVAHKYIIMVSLQRSMYSKVTMLQIKISIYCFPHSIATRLLIFAIASVLCRIFCVKRN